MAHEQDDDEVEIDLSEADTTTDEEPIDWDALDLDEPEAPIAPFEQGETSWAELDARALLHGDLDEPPPEFLHRTDGPALLYRGKVSSIAGEPESGKGWFAMAACIDIFAEGGHVVYLDFEDTPQGVFGRLRYLGVPDRLIAEKFHYIRPMQPLAYKTVTDDGRTQSNQTWLELLAVLKRAAAAEGGLSLIVFDGITEALATQSIESRDNDTVASWFGDVPRRLAHITNAAVLLIDHVTKSEDGRGRYAIGAGAKLAALDGSQFTINIRKAFARGRSGLARVSVAKDRPGHVRAVATGNGHMQAVADLVITAIDGDGHEGQLRVSLAPPDLEVTDDGQVKPTNVQAAIVAYLKRVKGQSRGRTQILDAVSGRTATKRAAFNEMVDEGWLVEVKNGRKTEYKIGTPKDAVNP